jgi:hypothetical protein
MKDSRTTVFRDTLDGVIESLVATLQVARWTGPESIPEPVRETASQLARCMGAADRLAGGRCAGPSKDAVRVNAMVAAMRRLDAAYVAYCRARGQSSVTRESAASALEAEITKARESVV